MNTNQPITTSNDLFAPSQVECSGSELAEVVASIEQRGGLVQRMEVVAISTYRLSVVWLKQLSTKTPQT